MSTATAWLVAGAVWCGCLVAGPWWLAIAGTLLVWVAAGCSPRTRMALLVVGLVAVGSGSAGARMALLQTGPLETLAAEGGQARIVARAVSEPRPTATGAWQVLKVSEVDGAASRHRALLRTGDAGDAPEIGSIVSFTATARPLGHEDFDRHLRRLHLASEVQPVTALTVVAGPGRFIRSTTLVRERVRAAASHFLPGDHAALLSGLVTGDVTGMSEQVQESFLAAGLTHLVAVSGSNVALVVAGTIAMCALVRIGARGRRRACVLALVWFAVLVRGEPSVLRASVMALLVLGASALGRGHDARHTLAVAAALLLLIDPMLAGQLGFALSVLATAGVLVGGPLIAAHVPGPRPLRVLVGATVGAQLGVAPVLLTMEGGLPAGALPANLVAVPAAAVASAVGVCTAVVAQVSTAAAGWGAGLAWPALSVILWAGEVFAGVGSITPGSLASPAVGLVAVAVVARRRLPRLATGFVVVAVVVVVAGPLGGPPTVTALTLTALDVGQGDALLVEVPGAGGTAAARMLVDGGPDEVQAVRSLRARGIDHLDVVVVSHPHADHANGLPAVVAGVRTGAVMAGPQPPLELEDPAASAVAVEAVAAQRGIPVLRAGAGQQFRLGEATVQILGPPADGSVGAEPNDNSLVFRIDLGDQSLLLTGDAEVAAQTWLLRRPDLLRADVLKVPHHGGNTNAEGFIDAVGAHAAVIGVGADNDYGHPHPDVLADLGAIRVVRTDVHGTVSVTAE